MKIATNQERLNELFDADPRNDTAIAADLGVSKQTVSAWRKGIRSPKKPMLIAISNKYNVSIEWLMGFDVERNANEDRNSSIQIVVPDNQRFVKLLDYMPQEDYLMVLSAFEKADQRMRLAEGENK